MKTPELSPVREPQKISSYLKREWKCLLLVTLTGLAFDGSMSYAAVLQGRLIDAVASKSAFTVVGQKALTFVLVVLLIQTCRALKRYFVRLFANRTGARMRRMLYNSVFTQDVTALSGTSAGELMNRAVGDVDICVEGMRKVTTEIFDTGVLMASYLITMFTYDVKTTLFACMFIPVAMFIAEKLKAVIERTTKLARAQNGRVSDITLSNVENALLYRVNSAFNRRLAAYETELTALEKKSVRADVLENSMQPVYNAIAMLGIVAILTRGGGLVVAKVWTVGDFTAFTAIFIALATKASKAAKLFNSYQKAAVSWQRLKPEIRDYHLPDETGRVDDVPAVLTVKDLVFSYPGAEEAAVSGVSFTAKAGELIGVTGGVASGKTALGYALTGALPYSGSAALCGTELSDFTPFERSRRVAYMGHDPQLLSDSILENVLLGEDADAAEALRLVCFDEDLAAMPEGVGTRIGAGGVRLSGGQRDRVALARTLCRPSRLVILDDPFSAVDTRTEKKILENLRGRFPDRIIVLISHRLTAFPQTDRVLFFENGSAVCSTHEVLLKESAAYQALWRAQTKGGRENEE
ncbi:MAG: ABC transporter ATP-binding protein [Oscillospiraceae bacterium]|jgi:ATP-binding cassette subfamily B multidrug efflux pump